MISYKNVVHENGGQNESIGNGLICIIWRMIMIYELATIEELQAVYDLVQHTIKKYIRNIIQQKWWDFSVSFTARRR